MNRHELCRLCDGRSDNINIFEEDDFEKKVKYVLDITVLVSDSKKTLCSFCKTKVTEFYDFKKRISDIEAKQVCTSSIKIKEEPLDPDEADVTSTSKLASPHMPYPWVPLGEPILLPELPYNTIKVKKENEVPVVMDIRPPILKIKEENLDELELDLERSIDNLIKQVGSDSESDHKSSVSSDMKQSDEKTDNEEKMSSGDKTSCDKSSGDKSSGEKSSDEESSASISAPRGGRGRKRRGGIVRGGMTSKRGRRLRSGLSPKTPENQVKRLTRSSTGTCPRRRVIDSSEDDGDFHDPDDPDDPEFQTSKAKSRSSSSSSSSEDEEPVKEKDKEKESESEPEREKEKEKEKEREKDPKKKVIRKTDLSLLLATAKQEKEEALKRQCPHCKLVYKHWVSYDEHVANCDGPKEKDPKDKTPPEDDREKKCVICLKLFKGSRALREHMEVHQPKKVPSHHCKICNENFPSKGGLICHNALKHRPSATEPIIAPDRKKHHCVTCNETFDSSGDYICHTVLKHKKK